MIQLKNITKSYIVAKEKYTVLHDIDLHVKKWEYLSIMWPSWSWKSTLMNIIWMLDTADSWEYYIDWKKVDNIKEKQRWIIRREKIGFIFQNYSLIPRMNVLEQVKLPLIYQWFSNHKSKIKALAALEKVWLKWKETSMPNELSWWQKQRVSVARALVISPKLMLADEPTWALDSKTSNEIMDLFDILNNEWKTIIIITHEQEIADRTSRTITIKDWNIIN